MTMTRITDEVALAGIAVVRTLYMRTARTVLVTALLATACDDSATGPSSGTHVEALVQDSPLTSPTVTGTLSGNVSASVWNGDRWNDLGSPNGITIPLQTMGRTTTVHGEASVASSSYTRVRLVFQGVTARLSRGSVVGGTTLSNDTSVALGGSDQRVEMSVPVDTFSVEPSASVRRVIVFELRSQQWLTAAALQAGVVQDGALQAAVTAATRAESR
jgi:hypothetical protein